MENIKDKFPIPCRSRSPTVSRCSRSRSKSIDHACRGRSRSWCKKSFTPSCSVESIRSRSCSRGSEKVVTSILKKHECVKRPKSPASVSFRVRTSRSPRRRSVVESYGVSDYYHVAPKVNCWNDKINLDRNLY